MQSTRLVIDVILNELQPAGVAEEGNGVRISACDGGRTGGEPGTAMSEIRKPGIFIHRCWVVRICDHTAGKDGG